MRGGGGQLERIGTGQHAGGGLERVLHQLLCELEIKFTQFADRIGGRARQLGHEVHLGFESGLK
ncbi:hypothetical protein LP419_04485 [Massilia sp. H-1]|nr:hypothetical protein LP419_04485 [Massilia sp. H-1]